MDDNTLLSRLLSVLPESHWAEVTRRLRAHPALWQAAHQPEALEAFVKLGPDLGQWRPGPLGLAALAARTSAAEGNAEAWLLGSEAGQARLAEALDTLRNGPGDPDLAQSAVAAVALRAGFETGASLSELAAEALRSADRWRLALACLYGLVDEPSGLIQALVQADGERGASLAAQVLLLNTTAAETVEAAQALAPGISLAHPGPIPDPGFSTEAPAPPRHLRWRAAPGQVWAEARGGRGPGAGHPGPLGPGPRGALWGALALAKGFADAGADELAGEVGRALAANRQPKSPAAPIPAGRSVGLPEHARQIVAGVEQALFASLSGDHTAAKQELAATLQALQHLSGRLTAALGEASHRAGDYVSALAAYQAALAEGYSGEEGTEVEALQAEALLALNRPAEALAELSKLPDPPPLALARAHQALDQAEEAREWAFKAALEAPPPGPQAPVARRYAALAKLFTELGETGPALEAQTQAVACRPWDGQAQARLAEMLWQAGRHASAHSAALQALAFGQDEPRFAARKIVAQHLSRLGQHAEAIHHWKAALAYSPEDSELTLSLARSAHAAGQAALARDAADAVLGRAADATHPLLAPKVHGEAHRILGEVTAAQGEHEQAVRHFEQAVALDPTQPGPWLSIASHRRQTGDLAGALEVLTQAGQRAPRSAEIAAALGHLYEDLGRTSDALAALTRACSLAPEEAQYQRDLGLALYQHRYLPGAIEAFRQALRLAPDDVTSLHHLALALLAEEGEPNEAYELLKRATALAPTDPAPYHDLGRLALRLHQTETALSALQAAIERQASPGETDTLALLGQAHEAAGDYEAALEAYRQAISLSPTRADLNHRIGVCCLAAGQIDAAIAALTDAVEADGASIVAHRDLGRAYAAAGMWSEAAMAFEYAATLSPGDAELHHEHGRAALGVATAGRPRADAAHWNSRAVTALQRATQITGNRPNATLLADLGHALTAAGRLDEARQAYDAALVLAPASADLRLDIAKQMMGAGDHGQASVLLAEAASLAPEDQDVVQAWAHASLLAGRLEESHRAFVRSADLAEAKGTGPAAGARRAGYLRQAGECIWSLGRTGEAVSFWQKALEVDPGDVATRARLGAALLQQGRPAEALAQLERVLEGKSGPPAPDTRLDAARAAIGAGDYERALGHVEQAIAEAPQEPEAHYLRGQALAALNKPLEALAAYREAARLDPNQGLYPAAIARALASQGETAEAVAAAETALELAGEQAAVLSAAGEVFLAVEDFRRAAEVLRRAADTQPDQAAAWMALAQALTSLVEAEAPWVEAGLPPTPSVEEAAAGRSASTVGDLLDQALHKAAVLGASPHSVREWTGRARAYLGDPKEAAVLLESATASAEALPAERQAQIYLALGHAYRRDGALDRARSVLETALAHARRTDDPGRRLSPAGRLYPVVLLELGQTALAMDDTATALNAGRRAAAAAPRNPVLLHFLAEALLAIGDRREAAAALERAIALQPDVAAWHSLLARTLHAPRVSPEDFAAALEHYRRAAQLDPQSALFALDLARALVENGDHLAAAHEYRRLTDLAPDSADTWREWGLLALKIGRVDKAAESFEKALALAPTDVEALVGSAQAALALGRLNEAQAKANSALRLSPDDPATLACLSEICLERGDTAGALAANAKAIASAPAQPDEVSLRLARARMLRAAGRLDEAIAELRRLTEDYPESAEAYGLLGDALAVTRRFEEASEQYRQALALAPQDGTHLLRLGRACLECGQLDKALAHLLQARDYAEGPAESADIHREIGRTYEARRQLDRALEFYREAIKLNPNQADNFLRAGMVHKLLKQYQEAQEHFQRVTELDPSNVEAHRQLVQVAAFELLHGAKLAALRN